MLEDVRGEPNRQSAPALDSALRRTAPTTNPRPASAPDPVDSSVTLPLRRQSKPTLDDKGVFNVYYVPNKLIHLLNLLTLTLKELTSFLI